MLCCSVGRHAHPERCVGVKAVRSMRPDLRHNLAEYQYLRERLKADFPDADEPTLGDTLEGLSTLPEALAAVVRSYLDDLALAAALGLRIGDMQERLGRIEQRA